MLQVEKRGRFITNMGFANFVTAAVESDDPRIKGTCMVILEETDPGIFDRGTPTRKLVHQLSSTSDPIFSLTRPRQPHHRRLHREGRRHRSQLQPRRSHRGRLPAHPRHRRHHDLGQAALSAIEPVIRYQRNRFRGGSIATPGIARYELGLQQQAGRRPPPGRCLGHRRSQRLPRLRGRSRVRRARSARKAEDAEIMAARGITGGTVAPESMRPGAERTRIESPASGTTRIRARRTTRSSSTRCSTAWPTSSARPASSGTPATAPT